MNLTADLDRHEGFHSKALWVFLEHESVFRVAGLMYHADTLSSRYWKRRTGLPKNQPDVSHKVMQELATALSAFYREKQGRGYRCKVDPYLRSNRYHYLFAYPEDYIDTFIGFDQDGSFARRPQRRAFEVIFVYDPHEGTLDLFAQGDKRLRGDLQEIFGRVMLKEELGPETYNSAPYHLNGLKDPRFGFPTEPVDGIAEVRVKRLRLSILGQGKRRIILEADPEGKPEEIYEMMTNWLNATHLPLAILNVTQATIQILFAPVGGARPKSLRFDISYPDACNLKSKREELRIIGEKYLKRWGIAQS